MLSILGAPIMQTLRKIVFWCHLVTGVIAGVVILVMSVTGTLLMYERQILAWADRGYRSAPPSSEATRLPIEALVAKAREVAPDANFTTITVRSAPGAPASFAAGPGRTLYVNPFTGDVLGEGSPGFRRVFRVLTDWHRWLGVAGENRTTGRAITGACNLGFLFIVVSGFYLWWPRSWGWAQLRSVTWFKRGLPGKARDFNWHNVIGLWSSIPLFIVVISAVPISYPWASNLVYRLVGEAPPPRVAPGGGGPAGPGGQGQPAQGGARRAQDGAQAPGAQRESRGERARPELRLDGVDALLAKAEAHVPGWQTIGVRLPTSADAPVSFTIDQGDGGQPQKRSQLTLDRQSGTVTAWEPFASQSLGRRLRALMRFAHTGEVLGFWGQTIAGLVSAGGAVLVWTGISLALRRLFAWRRRTRAAAASVAVTSRAASPSATAELVGD